KDGAARGPHASRRALRALLSKRWEREGGVSILAGHTDIDAGVAHTHVDMPQAIFGIASVAAGFDVEFPAVPGTHDVALVGEPKAATGLVRPELLLHARDHLALAHRAA